MSARAPPSPAAAALAAAETLDGYRAAIAASPLNAAARAKDRYVPFFLESPKDLARLEDEIAKIPLLNGSTTVILHPSADAGFPHTRPTDLLCLPAPVATQSSTASLAETLRHEAIHIHQRRNPSFWDAAARADGWEPAASSQLPLDLLQRCRLNPDTFTPTPFWSWDGRWIPLPLFTRDLQPTLGGIEIQWWDTEREALYLSPPSPGSERYGPRPSQQSTRSNFSPSRPQQPASQQRKS
jgi:hypothetical protein